MEKHKEESAVKKGKGKRKQNTASFNKGNSSRGGTIGRVFTSYKKAIEMKPRTGRGKIRTREKKWCVRIAKGGERSQVFSLYLGKSWGKKCVPRKKKL